MVTNTAADEGKLEPRLAATAFTEGASSDHILVMDAHPEDMETMILPMDPPARVDVDDRTNLKPMVVLLIQTDASVAEAPKFPPRTSGDGSFSEKN